jgi:hypothetical protein
VFDGNCDTHFTVEIEETGDSTLFIFQDSISLAIGDEIGLFDSEGIIDTLGNTGEILVGYGVWNGSQLSITAIHSVDLGGFSDDIPPGAFSGNEMVLKIWSPTDHQEYDASYSISFGSGTFTGLFTGISEVELVVGCEDDDADDICDDVDDCVGAYDECGVCNGDGIAVGACNCDGNVDDCAGVCGGSGSAVLGFSFTGSVIPAGAGTLLELSGEVSQDCLSNFIFSDSSGSALGNACHDGGMDDGGMDDGGMDDGGMDDGGMDDGGTDVPDAPTDLMAEAGDSQVMLTWNASDGAEYYDIYREGGVSEDCEACEFDFTASQSSETPPSR